MRTKDETNGYLLAIEQLLRQVENMMHLADCDTVALSDKSYTALRKARIELINASMTFRDVRAWNIDSQH